MTKVVQERFGEEIISTITKFAKSDLPSVHDFEQEQFEHVGDAQLRRILSETFYGARWIYKLGLALLVKDEEQMAHVRAQVLDYSAVCEGLLSDMLLHAINRGLVNGIKYQYKDIIRMRGRINWNVDDRARIISERKFYWYIKVSREERVITDDLEHKLDRMRLARNTVHLRARTHRAFLGTSRTLFDTTLQVIHETQRWRAANP